MSVAVHRHGDCLVARIETDLADREILQLRDELARRVGEDRIRGVVIDVTALEVMDSFAAQALRSIDRVVRLRGGATMVAGIQPPVATALVQFGIDLDPLHPQLDADKALAAIRAATERDRDDDR
jgi:rsbT antagonist protein RsbS